MNPRTTSIAAFCLVLIAGGLALLSRRDGISPADPEGVAEAGYARIPADGGGPAFTGRVGVEREAQPEKPPTAMEPLASTEPDRMVDFWIESASDAFDRTCRHLATDLNLSEAGVQGVEEVLNRRERELRNLLVKMGPGKADEEQEMVKQICALIRNKGLREDLVGVLSTDELAAFDAREARRERDTIEARAYREMAEINSVVQLTDSQKPDVLGVLMDQAPERIEQEADARAFMSLTYGPLATDMESGPIRGLTNMLTADPTQNPDLGDYGSREHQQWIERQKAERIGNELSALSGILGEDQLKRYREHLESQRPW